MSGFKLLILQTRELRPTEAERVAWMAVCLIRLVRQKLASGCLWVAEGVTGFPSGGRVLGGEDRGQETRKICRMRHATWASEPGSKGVNQSLWAH